MVVRQAFSSGAQIQHTVETLEITHTIIPTDPGPITSKVTWLFALSFPPAACAVVCLRPAIPHALTERTFFSALSMLSLGTPEALARFNAVANEVFNSGSALPPSEARGSEVTSLTTVGRAYFLRQELCPTDKFRRVNRDIAPRVHEP